MGAIPYQRVVVVGNTGVR